MCFGFFLLQTFKKMVYYNSGEIIMRFSNLMDTFSEGIFANLNNKKLALEARGKKVYDLFVGTPDFKPDSSILNAMKKALDDPNNIKYSLHDMDILKDRFIKHYKDRFHVSLNRNQIMTVNGTQEGMCHIGMLLANPGEYCLLPDPGYVAFTASAKFARLNIITYPLLEENDFMPRLDLLDSSVLKKIKYVIISYPSNPTGGVINKERYIEIIELARKYGFIIVNDNAYSDIIFDHNESFSFLSLPYAFEVGCEFYSLSKSYNTTGARISFFLGSEEIVSKFNTLRSQYDFGMFYPIQYAAIAALDVDKNIIEAQRHEYELRRNTLCDGLSSIGWRVNRSKGTMFVFAKIPDKYEDSLEFAEDLLEKTGVLCTPGSAFGTLGKKYVRFALVKPVEELQEIIRIIDESGILK